VACTAVLRKERDVCFDVDLKEQTSVAFVLMSISDTVQIPPSLFHHLSGRGNTLTAVECVIDAKYPNRVLPDTGLAICRCDVLHVGAEKGGWVWCPEFGEEGEGEGEGEDEKANEAQEFRMEVGDRIRFRVKSVHYARVTATAKGLQSTTTSTHAGSGEQPHQSQPGQRRRSSSMDLRESGSAWEVTVPPCMYVIGSILEDGLGLPSWGSSGDDDEEEGPEGEEEEPLEEGYDGTPAADEEYATTSIYLDKSGNKHIVLSRKTTHPTMRKLQVPCYHTTLSLFFYVCGSALLANYVAIPLQCIPCMWEDGSPVNTCRPWTK